MAGMINNLQDDYRQGIGLTFSKLIKLTPEQKDNMVRDIGAMVERLLRGITKENIIPTEVRFPRWDEQKEV